MTDLPTAFYYSGVAVGATVPDKPSEIYSYYLLDLKRVTDPQLREIPACPDCGQICQSCEDGVMESHKLEKHSESSQSQRGRAFEQ